MVVKLDLMLQSCTTSSQISGPKLHFNLTSENVAVAIRPARLLVMVVVTHSEEIIAVHLYLYLLFRHPLFLVSSTTLPVFLKNAYLLNCLDRRRDLARSD